MATTEIAVFALNTFPTDPPATLIAQDQAVAIPEFQETEDVLVEATGGSGVVELLGYDVDSEEWWPIGVGTFVDYADTVRGRKGVIRATLGTGIYTALAVKVMSQTSTLTATARIGFGQRS